MLWLVWFWDQLLDFPNQENFPFVAHVRHESSRD